MDPQPRAAAAGTPGLAAVLRRHLPLNTEHRTSCCSPPLPALPAAQLDMEEVVHDYGHARQRMLVFGYNATLTTGVDAAPRHSKRQFDHPTVRLRRRAAPVAYEPFPSLTDQVVSRTGPHLAHSERFSDIVQNPCCSLKLALLAPRPQRYGINIRLPSHVVLLCMKAAPIQRCRG